VISSLQFPNPINGIPLNLQPTKGARRSRFISALPSQPPPIHHSRWCEHFVLHTHLIAPSRSYHYSMMDVNHTIPFYASHRRSGGFVRRRRTRVTQRNETQVFRRQSPLYHPYAVRVPERIDWKSVSSLGVYWSHEPLKRWRRRRLLRPLSTKICSSRVNVV
jgi:hypothetical protein